MLEQNIKFIKERIYEAALSAGRGNEQITLLAVTKTVSQDIINESLVLGVEDIGENKVQEAYSKFSGLTRAVRKHFIGHLQTNKVKKAVEIFDVIQSLDSVNLAVEVQKYAEKSCKVQECMVEVKMSEEQSKYGINPTEVDEFLESISAFKNIKVIGLMTMAPYFEEKELARPYFRKAFEIYTKVKAMTEFKDFKYLSMGMSHDFEIAIQEGSNMVRIGTALFGKRTYD